MMTAGLFVDGRKLGNGTKAWTDKLKGHGEMTWLDVPDKEALLRHIGDARYSMVGAYGHGNKWGLYLTRIIPIDRIHSRLEHELVSTREIEEAMANRPAYRLVILLNCYSFEADVAEALIGDSGAAVTFKGTVLSMFASRKIKELLDLMVANPDTPISELLQRIQGHIAKPIFQGNRDLTLNQVFADYMSKDDVMRIIMDFFVGKATKADAMAAVGDYFHGGGK